MIRKNKLTLIISSIVILLPMLIGVFGDRFLSDEIAIHWGIGGEADGFASPLFAFTVIPLILLAVHWLCVILTSVLDKSAAEQNSKLIKLVLWLIPAMSISISAMMLMIALGHTSNMGGFVLLLIGVLFVVIGNYMPKARRSITTGIKIKWTLANDENWQATHRFAGKLYVAFGFASILLMPISYKVLPFALIGIMVFAVVPPIIYSYRFYKKQLADGKVTKEDYEREYRKIFKNPKAAKTVGVVAIAALVIVLAIVMLGGSFEVALGEESIDITAGMWSDASIDYDDIEDVEYRESRIGGHKVNGFNSAKLWLGIFKNDELGVHTRYTYQSAESSVILTVDGKYIVIATESEDENKAIYEKVAAEIADRGAK